MLLPTARTGLTTHTLRFYEQERLFFAPVRRDADGRRVLASEEVEWLKVCTKPALGVIHAKVETYARHLAAGTADQLWRDGPECD